MRTFKIAAFGAALCSAAFCFAGFCSCGSMQAGRDVADSVPREVKEWEKLAEAGDTAAMHKLLQFYDENSFETCEIAEVMTAEGEDVTDEYLEEQKKLDTELNNYYNERLDYWLDRGLGVQDPVALYIKGMRLYYTDEASAVTYLAPAAAQGNGKAALFCGSALYNLDRGQEAIKYFVMADESGEPSAGWHLAQCYAGNAGVKPDRDKAIQYLVKSGLKNYPEAVLELKRIDPGNPKWRQKADSLAIDMPDFKVIPD